MGKEEQAEEFEILESIYPEELEVQSETSLAIHLKLETEVPKQLLIEIEYPETYPEETIPGIHISVESSDSDVPESKDESSDEPKFTYDFTRADCEELTKYAKEIAEENLGIASVFTVVSMVKERAEELYESRIKDQEAERLRLLTLEEEKEQAKFHGTPVTKESFNKWRTSFRAEMGWDKPKERPSGRFTGREIFVKGMYKEEDEEEAEKGEEED